jgi:hypothetical protein
MYSIRTLIWYFQKLKYFEIQLFHVTAIVLVDKYSVDMYCSNIVIGLTIQEYKLKLKLEILRNTIPTSPLMLMQLSQLPEGLKTKFLVIRQYSNHLDFLTTSAK